MIFMRFLLIFMLFVSSCSTKKDVLLLQDTKPTVDYSFKFTDIKIQPNDILRVDISSKSTNVASLYNANTNFTPSTSLLGYMIEGYLVNSKGSIDIPALKPLNVKDLTIEEATQKIQMALADEEVLKDATVDIKILNSYFTVLGEVNLPGRYSFLENNLNIFQAIGIAGDLTINGKRDDIKIISKNDGNMNVSSVDLTSSELLVSPRFQIFPGDIIIVNANNARVKNAGIVGNFGNLLSAMSFVLSSLILITNN